MEIAYRNYWSQGQQDIYESIPCSIQAEVIQNHENANVRDIVKGETRHRTYKRCKLGGCQAYDRSNDWAAVATWATWVRAWSAVQILDCQETLYILYIYMYVGKSIIIRNVAILYFNTNRKLTLTRFFNIAPLIFNAFGPSLHELPYALRKECSRLSSEPRVTASFISWSRVHRRTQQMIIRKGEIGTIRGMSHYNKLEFPQGFSSVGSSMWTGIAMQQHNTFRQ
jgi:hypothetical protein